MDAVDEETTFTRKAHRSIFAADSWASLDLVLKCGLISLQLQPSLASMTSSTTSWLQ